MRGEANISVEPPSWNAWTPLRSPCQAMRAMPPMMIAAPPSQTQPGMSENMSYQGEIQPRSEPALLARSASELTPRVPATPPAPTLVMKFD